MRRTPTPAQLEVLTLMEQGYGLVGSGLGGGTLLDGHDMMHASTAQTHQALIRRK